MGYKLNLNKRKAEDLILKRVEVGMRRALTFADGYCKRSISVGNKTGRSPSAPGQPPHVVTGTLRSSIGTQIIREPGKVRGFIGVRKGATSVGVGKGKTRMMIPDSYGFYLEVGTSRMAARPFLRPTVTNNRARLGRLIAGGK
jgi:HK97 gp10 family phage protein